MIDVNFILRDFKSTTIYINNINCVLHIVITYYIIISMNITISERNFWGISK